MNLYTFLISYRFLQAHQRLVIIVQLGIVFVTGLMATEFPEDNLQGGKAGLICMFYPVLVAYAFRLLPETFMTFLLVLGVLLYARSKMALSGTVFALAILTMPILLCFPPFWIAWKLISSHKPCRECWKWLGAYFICLAPFIALNYRYFLVIHNFPAFPVDFMRRSAHFWITSHSDVFGFQKSIFDYQGLTRFACVAVKGLGWTLQGLLLSYAIIGAFRAYSKPGFQFLIALVGYTWVMSVLNDSGPSKMVPLIPFLVILGVS